MSASSPYGDPPAGTDVYESKSTTIYGSIIPVAVIGTIVVALRARARTVNGMPGFQIDDFTVIVALFCTWGTAICCFFGMRYGLGKHIWVLDTATMETLWQILYAYIMIYATSVALINHSILLFYRRIFQFEASFYIMTFVLCVYWAIIIVVMNFGCRPLRYFWGRFVDPNAVGTCIDTQAFFLANSIWVMINNTAILVMPIPTVMRLQMPLGERLAVVAIMMLGGFVCIACIIRIMSVKSFLHSTDITWDMTSLFVWSCVEPFVGLICACLPTFGPYYRKWWSKVHSSWTGGSIRAYIRGHPGPRAITSANSRDIPNGKRSRQMWSSLGGSDMANLTYDGRLRDDDEVELTTEITGGPNGSALKLSSDNGTNGLDTPPDRGIQVKEEFVWTSEVTNTRQPS